MLPGCGSWASHGIHGATVSGARPWQTQHSTHTLACVVEHPACSEEHCSALYSENRMCVVSVEEQSDCSLVKLPPPGFESHSVLPNDASL